MSNQLGLNTQNITALIKPPVFELSTAWRSWKFAFVNYVVVLDQQMGDGLQQVEKTMTSLEPTDEGGRQKCTLLFALLGGLTRGAPQRLVEQQVDRNGFSVWLKLITEYEPRTSSRRVALLHQILSPPFGPEDGDLVWKESYEEWRRTLTVYESIAQRALDPEILSALVMIKAPSDLKTHLLMRSTEFESDFNLLCSTISAFIASRRPFDADQMDVSAVSTAGGSRCAPGRKDHNGGGGGGGGGGGRDKDAKQKAAEKLKQIECFNCHKKGHYRSKCPLPPQQQQQYSSSSSSSQSNRNQQQNKQQQHPKKPGGKKFVKQIDEEEQEEEQEQEGLGESVNTVEVNGIDIQIYDQHDQWIL